LGDALTRRFDGGLRVLAGFAFALAGFAFAVAFVLWALPERVPAVAEGETVSAAAASFALGACGAASVAVALRAAVLRALERCGRVRGRFESNPAACSGCSGRPLLLLGELTRTSLLNRGLARTVQETWTLLTPTR
jgi:hypothetical protein